MSPDPLRRYGARRAAAAVRALTDGPPPGSSPGASAGRGPRPALPALVRGAACAALALWSSACGAGQPPATAESTAAQERAAPGTAPGTQAYVGARILDGTGTAAIEDGVLVVRDGRVAAVGAASAVRIPEDAEVVRLDGRWLVPGFINAHGHVNGGRESAEAELRTYARYGITTVVSLGGETSGAIELRNEQDTPDLDRARIYVAGPVLSPRTPEAARDDVARVAAMGVDWVKIRVDDQLGRGQAMQPAVYTAVIEAARAAGLRTAVHIVRLEDAKGVLRAGASLIGHSVRDAAVDDELIRLMRERNVCLVPTFTRELSTFVYAERPAFFDDPFFTSVYDPASDAVRRLEDPRRQQQMRDSESAAFYRQALPLAQRNAVALHEAGIGIAMGTDTGPEGRFQGYFEHLEMEMMVDAGMSPGDVFHAATGGAARCMGLEGTVGTLQPGAWADFVALTGDPRADITNTRSIQGVWIAGNRVR